MPSRVVCFVCGSLGGHFQLHSRPREGSAYFPFLEHHDPPKGSRLPGQDGVVDACRVCYAFLTQQWESYERSSTPAIKRLYWLKRSDDGQFTGAEMKLQGEYMAQVMGLQYQPSCGDNCAPLSPEDSANFSSRDGFGMGSREHESHGRKFEEREGVLDLSVPVKSETSSKSSCKSGGDAERNGRPSSRSKPVIEEFSFVCFTCGVENQGVAAKFISSTYLAASEPYFPFLTKVTPASGAIPLSSQGICRVCDHCFSSLCHQWLTYEQHGTPSSARIFKVKDSFFSNDSSIVMGGANDVLGPSAREVCYLCSQPWPAPKMCALFTVPSGKENRMMYFPFIKELRRPHGARPLNPDGSVRVCISCYGNLQVQWQAYETENIPLLQRRYSLLPLSSSAQGTSLSASSSSTTDGGSDVKLTAVKREEVPKSLTQPLNIDVSESPTFSKSHSHGLLAVVPPSHSSSATNPSANHASKTSATSSIMNSSSVAYERSLSAEQKQSSGGATGQASSSTTIPHPLQQAGERPKKVCFLCGEKCLASRAKTLFSYPVRHEAKSASSQSQTIPFFPFLANQEPAPGADSFTEEGSVLSCSYCYHSLLNQWRDYEESKSPTEKNRWLRKYTLNEFVCFVCGTSVPRRKMRTLEVQKFPFLREHKAPPTALVMWAGEAVGACGACHFSLTHQYADFERLGLPVELRKYNWTVQHQAHIDENSCDTQDSIQRPPSASGNEDSNLSVTDVGEDSNSGLPPGSKPPLQMMSPVAMAAAASGKLPPKTATVPPLHQVSPSNGLSTSAAGGSLSGSHTSSFAAALRKLAHQAKDPAEEAILKHGGSPPSSHSPRAATPKRPPLMFPAHSSSPASLTSPPVVTIAPTQAHHHASLASSDSRQNMERVPTAHSSSSYEHSGKHEREQRPLSSLSREEERAAGKDNPLSRTPSRAHPQASTTPNGVGLSSQALDMYTRSLQAFRAEEEAARHGLPLPYTLDPAAYAAAAAAAAAYHPALLQQQAAFAAQSPFRFDDPLLLERYRMLQSPYLPFPAGGLLSPHAGALGMHPMLAAAAAAQQRYPADLALLQQQYQYLGAGHPLLDPRFAAQAALLERSRLEEEKARDLIEKEREREREREREKSLDREIEREAALRSERERKHSLERSVRESQEREHRRSMERAARESSEQERRLSLERSAKELLERRDILTVPSRLPASHGAERGPESHHKSHGDGHGARHSTIGRPSSSQAKVEPHNLSSKLSPSGYPLSSREAADQHAGLASHSHSYSKSHESAATAAYNAALVKPHTLEKGHDYLPAHAHRDSRSGHKDPRESPRSSSVGSNIPPGFPLSYYHQPSHLIPGASSAVSPSDAQHPPRSLHPSHLSPSSSSSTHHSDKVRRSSDSSGIFRPFDDDSKPSDSSHHPSSQRNVSQNHHHHHQPHHHHSSSSSSTPSQSQQHHRHHHGHRPTSPSKSSEILTIPSVKVHPQERGSNPPSKVLYNSHERLPSSSLSAHPSSQASPQYGKTSNISNCINDRIERFDFKSLARECMSSTASGLPSEKAGAATGAEVCEIATSVPAAKAMDVQPKRCLSKLDRQELRVRERRKRGEDTESDTEMDEDERIAARLTMIGRATPIPLDTPTEKMEIFEYLGITTLKRKEELQRKKEVRRRHQLRMSSVSPVRRHDDDSCTAGWHSPWLQEGLLPEMGPIHPDELSSEPDVHDKSRFLSGLGLQVLTHTQRDELQRKRFFRVALSKLRRNGLMPSRSLDSLNLETGSCGVKRKFDEMNPNHPAPTSMKEQKTALRISAPCHPTLKGDSSVAHTSHPHLLTFTNNHDHNNHHHHHHHHHQQQHNHQNRQHRHPVPSVLEPAPRRDNRKPSAAATTTTSSSSSTIKQAVIFPEPKSSARSGPQPSASREFAERFHKSVLEQSGLDHSRVPRQEVPAVTSSISSVPVPSSSASSQSQSQSRPLQESAAAPPPSATSSRSASGMTAVYPGFHMPPGIPPSLYASLAWPRHGLGPGAGAAGLEHFSRPREGAADLSQQQQQAELQLLMSRCQQQQQQQASSDQMDRLSESYGRHMAAFLEERQRMEEERKQHQGAMDNLKRNFYNFS